MVVDLVNNVTYTQYTGCGTGPILNPVAFALNMAGPGDVVGVTGDHPIVFFQANPSNCNQNAVGWGGGVVHDVDIVGLDNTAGINGIFLQGDISQAGGGGIDRVTFQGLRLHNQGGSRSPVQSTNSKRNGLLRIYDCAMDADDPTAWSGKGMKFGMRLYLTSLDARDNIYPVGAEEHNIYIDSPGWNGAYDPSFIAVNNKTFAATGRTGIQVVNRLYPAEQNVCNPGSNPVIGSPGLGKILIRNNRLFADASAGGGATVTIAGHHGDVWIEDNTLGAFGGAGGSVDTAGIVVWEPCSTWINDAGFATNAVHIEGNQILGTGSRANVGIASTGYAWVGVNTFATAGEGVRFNRIGETPNGSEFLPPSTMAGWQQGGPKAFDTLSGVYTSLTDTQIDTLY